MVDEDSAGGDSMFVRPVRTVQTTIDVKVFDMTPLAAETAMDIERSRAEVARVTHAVPAQEETRRSLHYNWRVVIFGLFAAGGIAVACYHPSLSTLIGGVLTAFAAGAFGPTIVRSFQKKSDD